MRIVFDIEANGLLNEPWRTRWGKGEPPPTADKVHCLSLLNVDGGSVFTTTEEFNRGYYMGIEEGLHHLSSATTLIGHNIIRYDLPMLKKFYNWEPTPGTRIMDTLVMSHLGYTSLTTKDQRVSWRDPNFPRSLTGKHSLRAWGHRIGALKGHANDTDDFSVCDEEMLRYCERDVEVNAKLFLMMEKSWAGAIPETVDVEHEFYVALEGMMECGWMLDTEHTRDLVLELQAEKERLDGELSDLFPAREVLRVKQGFGKEECLEPQNPWWNPKQLKTKDKVYQFNPSSSAQVIWNLWKKYGWTPTKFTDKGNPSLTDDILSAMHYPEAQQLTRYAMVTKRLASLVGPSGYLTLMGDDGRVHGNIAHCGAVTHRCTHSEPNNANVTGNSAEYGREIRGCFATPEGYALVGADASALELCMLANRMSPFDGGEYGNIVVNGDPHTRNWKAAKLDELVPRLVNEETNTYHKRIRNEHGKTMIYALLYGCGDEKLGATVGKGADTGKKMRANLFKGFPALKRLIKSLKSDFKTNPFTAGLDGRIAENRSAHQALNTQLQMDGAIVMKWATVLVHRAATKMWGNPGADNNWCMVGHIHDEYQFQVKEDIADDFGKLAVECFTEAGRLLSVCCRLDGDYSVGKTWADTH